MNPKRYKQRTVPGLGPSSEVELRTFQKIQALGWARARPRSGPFTKEEYKKPNNFFHSPCTILQMHFCEIPKCSTSVDRIFAK